ncbi:MAG: hypothetical protein WD361_14885 [Gracilimonas sp.]
MKKIKLLFGIILFLGIIISCGDTSTDTNEETTVEQDIANIENTLDNTISLLSDLEDGNFSSSMKSFLGMSSGNVNSEDWIDDVFSGLEDYIDVESTEDNQRFDFNAHTGEYTYASSGEWTKSSSNNIVLNFPSSENSSGNDMKMTISGYQDVSVNIDGDSYYLPSALALSIEKNNDELFAFNLNELQYSDNPDLPIPTRVDLDIYTAPFNNSFDFSRQSSTDFEFVYILSDADDTVFGIELKLSIAHDNYSELDDDDFEELSGEMLVTSDMKIVFDVDIGTLITIDDPSENQINTLFNASVLYNDVSIGELEYSEEEEDILIVYKDGTSESTSRYYEDFLEKLETVFFSFTGDWVDF